MPEAIRYLLGRNKWGKGQLLSFSLFVSASTHYLPVPLTVLSFLEFIMSSPRLPWPEYFMQITFLVSQRSTCLRRKVGAMAVKDRHILATGYNGSPSGIPHCLETGCLREQMGIPSGERHEICVGLHAEQNVIIQAAVHGISLSGAEIYCTHQPCLICTKMLINCGVQAVYFARAYPDELATKMAKQSGIPFQLMEFSSEHITFPVI